MLRDCPADDPSDVDPPALDPPSDAPPGVDPVLEVVSLAGTTGPGPCWPGAGA